MRSNRLLPALAILFACVSWITYKSFERNGSPTPAPLPENVLSEWLIGKTELVDPAEAVGRMPHELIDVVWDGLRQMDLKIVAGDMKAAGLIRQRLAQVANWAKERSNRGGYLELIAAHADYLDADGKRMILDPDATRATRRLTAQMALEMYWNTDEDLHPAEALPGVDPRAYQTSELAWALRHTTELLRENRTPATGVVSMAATMIRLSQSEPSALVRGERAFLLFECWISGLADGRHGVGPVEMLDCAASALAGQAPQRNELLDLILRVAPLVPEGGQRWRRTAVDYVLKLGELAPARLWRQALGLAATVELQNEREVALSRHLTNRDSVFYGAALHVTALDMVDSGRDKVSIFATFDSALKVVMNNKNRADLMVDIGVYERECAKDTRDNDRRYLQSAVTRFRKAVELDSGHVAARLNMAQVALKARDSASAKNWLEGIDDRVMSSRQTAIGHSIWAHIHIKAKEWTEARRRLQKAQVLVPDLPGLDLIRREVENHSP